MGAEEGSLRLAPLFSALRLSPRTNHRLFVWSTDQSIVSGGRNYVKITSGIKRIELANPNGL